ncbi:winged helix-turn-helix transcriptional regulator [Streptomyces sp. NPDC001700]
MPTTGLHTAPQIGAIDAQRVEQALRVLARKWTTWIIQTLPQGRTPMRGCDIARALPFIANPYPMLNEMHTAGLVTRIGDHTDVSYQLTARGDALTSVHRALEVWSHAHLTLGETASAERIEDAARRLRLRQSTATVCALDAIGPASQLDIAHELHLGIGYVGRRLARLQHDGLATRTGSHHGAWYLLTEAGRALGPVYAAIEYWSQLDLRDQDGAR